MKIEIDFWNKSVDKKKKKLLEKKIRQISKLVSEPYETVELSTTIGGLDIKIFATVMIFDNIKRKSGRIYPANDESGYGYFWGEA